MNAIRDYLNRVSDYMNDPIMPPNKLNPWMWAEALYYSLWNKWLYLEDEEFRKELVRRQRSKEAE
jgi:hypothetical protein